MINTKGWALRRQLIIVTGLLVVFAAVAVYFYYSVLYVAPTCFDGEQNGMELGVDCGGGCVRICEFEVSPPNVTWIKAFKIIDGQYNVVAYVENPNAVASAPEITYTITLKDSNGLIEERSGTTILPSAGIYPIFEGRIKTGNRVPTDVSITLGEPELWLPVTGAQEQFTLVDRGEITNADSAPRLQSSIRNNGFETAKNVEVITTIFDSHGTPLTVSRTFTDFPAERVTDVIFTWPEPIAATLRSCEVPTDVILAIDLSGSMNNLGGVPPEPLASVKGAAENFVSRLRERDRAGIISFATNGTIEVPLQPAPATVAAEISKLTIGPDEESGTTNSGAAFQLALQEFSTERHNPDARKVFVLLTDGLTNEPEPDPEGNALARAAALKNSGVTVYTIGLGEEVNETFLRSAASSPDNYFASFNTEDVDRIYRSVTEALCEDGAAIVDVIPKTDVNFIQWP